MILLHWLDSLDSGLGMFVSLYGKDRVEEISPDPESETVFQILKRTTTNDQSENKYATKI